MKSAKPGGSSSIKRVSKTDHALLEKLYKKPTPNGFGRRHAETENVLKNAGGQNAATFFDNFKHVQAKDTEPDGKATAHF